MEERQRYPISGISEKVELRKDNNFEREREREQLLLGSECAQREQ